MPSHIGESRFSRTLIGRSGYRGERFTATYDRSRPVPPTELIETLMRLARTARPRLVVDLGAGTGLSARVWAPHAIEVVGIEPNADMLACAERIGDHANVRYVRGYASGTGLVGARADIVTCAQSFHWMEPTPVLAEAARILRPGGVFAAYDYDVPPSVEPELDAAFAAHLAARHAARRRLGLESGTATWPKAGHVAQLRECGHFQRVREAICEDEVSVDLDRILGLAESLGGPPSIHGDAAPDVRTTFDRLREVAGRVLVQPLPMVVRYRIRAGIR